MDSGYQLEAKPVWEGPETFWEAEHGEEPGALQLLPLRLCGSLRQRL